MKKINTNQILIILIPISILTLLNSALIGYLFYKNDTQNIVDPSNSQHKDIQEDSPVAETHNSVYDFGQITKEDGVVSTKFEIENHGKETLKIEKISTSCGCTTAEINKETLGFNEKASLTVNFDPNFHEEPEGKFERIVYVETNDKENPELQFTITVEII